MRYCSLDIVRFKFCIVKVHFNKCQVYFDTQNFENYLYIFNLKHVKKERIEMDVIYRNMYWLMVDILLIIYIHLILNKQVLKPITLKPRFISRYVKYLIISFGHLRICVKRVINKKNYMKIVQIFYYIYNLIQKI